MSWLTEFDDDDNEIEDPWKALDSFIERNVEFHVWIDMGKRLRDSLRSFAPDLQIFPRQRIRC